MTEISIREDGQTASGNRTFTVTVDGDGKGQNLTKIEAMMTLWSVLQLSHDDWEHVKSEFQKMEG